MGNFMDVFADVTKQARKVPASEYMPSGKYPIYDQGQSQIAGYTDEEDGLFTDIPAIIFGDHTRIVKYVDEPCFIGADGVKLLKPLPSDVDVKYLFYATSAIRIPNTGYNRHFKWLKEANIVLPDRMTQSRIAAMFAKLEELMKLQKQQLAKLDELVKARFVEMFERHSWETVLAGSIMHEMRNGVSPTNSGRYHAKVLTLSAITQGVFNADAWKDGVFYYSPSEDKRVSSSDFYICRGNGNKRLVGVGAYSIMNRPDLVFPDTIIAARIDERQVSLPYLCNAWKSPSVRSQIESAAQTTNGTYKINQKTISNVKLVLPPLSLQHEFAAYVAQADKSKLTTHQRLDKLAVLKKALMQKYFG